MEKDELKIISHHVFLYPFRWDYVPMGKRMDELNFDARTDFEKWKALFNGHRHWKPQDFIIGGRDFARDYNEFTFFYDFVRKSIYNFESEEESVHRMLFYDYPLGSNATYTINTKKGNFKLNLADINLHIFDTGIGILTFQLQNFSYKDKAEILIINDYGRRIYPQFLGKNFEKDTQYAFLATHVSLDPDNGGGPFDEDFSFYGSEHNLRKQPPLRLPQFIQKLFDGIPLGLERKGTDEFIRLSNIMDDRMFTMCWYGNDILSKSLVPIESSMKSDMEGEYRNTKFSITKTGKKHIYPHKDNNWWYAYTFIDRSESITCQNPEEVESYIKKHTYARWANYGTFYGLSRETFMVLSNSKKTCLENFAPPIWDHLITMYYQIVILCLAQRASVLRFSGEVSRLAGKLKREDKNLIKADEINNVYLNYIEFVNKLYFREVTAQVQGIELYEMLQKHMNLDRDVKDLDSEIDELHKYMVLEEQERNNRTLSNLTFLGGAFLLPGFLFGFLGMNMFDPKDFQKTSSDVLETNINWIQFSLTSLTAVFLLGGLSLTFYLVWKGNSKILAKIFMTIFLAIFVAIAFLSYFAYFTHLQHE